MRHKRPRSYEPCLRGQEWMWAVSHWSYSRVCISGQSQITSYLPQLVRLCGKGCSLRSYDPKCAATQNSLVEGVLTVGSYEWERYISLHLPQVGQAVTGILTTGEKNNQSVLTVKRKARGGVKQTEEQSLRCKYLSDNTPDFLELNPVGSVVLGIRHSDAGVRITKSAGSWPCKQE